MRAISTKTAKATISSISRALFAGDSSETFKLEIREKLENETHFEFFAVTGKTYTIEESFDGEDVDLGPLFPRWRHRSDIHRYRIFSDVCFYPIQL